MPTAPMGQATDHSIGHRNEVLLVGRLAAAPTARPLPSGDSVSTWRVVVNREGARTRRRGRAVDALECAAFDDEVRSVVEGWEPGDVVEVRGALRRRFWRGASGLASRYEIEVDQARQLAVASGPRTGSPNRRGGGQDAAASTQM